MPFCGSRRAGSLRHDQHPPWAHRALLHPAPNASTQRQPAHHCLLSGYVPVAVEVCARSHGQAAVQAHLTRSQRRADCSLPGRVADQRAASAATYNLRLTAIRAFFRFLAFEEPADSGQIQRVLAIPGKIAAKREISFLHRAEIEAILAAPDRRTWLGRRDYALLLTAVQTGLRLSELVGLDREAADLGAGAHVRCIGKGRKERATPLTKMASATLQAWRNEPPRRGSTTLFPTLHGDRMSADAVQYLLAKHVATAAERCPSLARKRVSPHVLRHSAAMELLEAGVDTTVISLGSATNPRGQPNPTFTPTLA